MTYCIIKSKGQKAAEIAEDFKQDLDFLNCNIYDSIDDVMNEFIVIFIVTIQNTMNTYLSDLDKIAQDKFFL